MLAHDMRAGPRAAARSRSSPADGAEAYARRACSGLVRPATGPRRLSTAISAMSAVVRNESRTGEAGEGGETTAIGTTTGAIGGTGRGAAVGLSDGVDLT